MLICADALLAGGFAGSDCPCAERIRDCGRKPAPFEHAGHPQRSSQSKAKIRKARPETDGRLSEPPSSSSPLQAATTWDRRSIDCAAVSQLLTVGPSARPISANIHERLFVGFWRASERRRVLCEVIF